jgi:hypothetical protein
LGFWNPITSSYERTAAIDLLLRAQSDPEHPYFLILDEMNLARVEYYFSDFLSAMESGEPIPLYSGEAHDDGVPSKLGIPSNLFVVGTVNVDETTHAFSPKVLDRASVIEFNDVLVMEALFGADTAQTAEPFRLAEPVLDPRAFAVVKDEDRSSAKDDLVDSVGWYAERLVDLHGLLERYDRHFGYRVIDEITTYVALARARIGADDLTLATAFDLAVCQKVLPKLNGGRELDEPLRWLLAYFIDPTHYVDSWKDSEETWNELNEQVHGSEGPAGVAYSRSAHKTVRMLRKLAQTGFVSFLE